MPCECGKVSVLGVVLELPMGRAECGVGTAYGSGWVWCWNCLRVGLGVVLELSG